MEREQVIQMYLEDAAGPVEEYRRQMGQHLLERSEQLESMVRDALKCLGEKIREQGKEYVSFFYVSLLRTDLQNRNYRFLLHSMNLQWYLDGEPVEVYFGAGDLLEPLDKLWDILIKKSQKYMGVVNLYDIQHILFGELKSIDSAISRILRYRLRDWESKGIFSNISLSPYWLFKWGEYRDQSEFILQTDRTPKGKEMWQEEVRKAAHKPETMVFGYWYQGEYEGDRLEMLDMRFTVFEECSLKALSFDRCNLEGSRFTGSKITGCSFAGCNLWGADFMDCTFEGATFSGSELSGARFPSQSIPFLNLDPEQLQTILIKREECP